jgi:hypothetical protein
MLNHYDLGLYVGWFEIPHDFIGLPELYGLKCENLITSVIVLYLCSYNLDGSMIASIGAKFNIKLIKCVLKTKVLFYKIGFINL